MALVYYDAKTDKVYSMDAGYNSYLSENDPLSIPVCDLGPLNAKDRSGTAGGGNMPGHPFSSSGDKGRETLVPGFMAGIEALHKRFGTLPFADLFQPALWYAEHGTIVNSRLERCFAMRQNFLARTPEGQQFMRQAGADIPKQGDRFVQPQLAATLRAVAREGAKYMYTGVWGQRFVAMIVREGGKVSSEDMAGYQVTWSQPLSTTYLGHEVFTAGAPSQAAYHVLTGLNLAESLKLHERGNYWQDPTVLGDLQRISDATDRAPALDERLKTLLKSKGIDYSPESQLTKQYASALTPLLDQLYGSPKNEPHHSNSIVAIDKDGNIAAITHTINSVTWGDTGIIVDGIPIPDSAGFQQERLASLTPGARLPNEMVQTIVFKDKKPILATAAIGASMNPETLRIIVGLIGKKVDLDSLQAAPPVMYNFMIAQPGKPAYDLGLVIPNGSYDEAFVKELAGLNAKVTTIPAATASGLRGTVTAVTIDPSTAEKRTAETPAVLIFGAAY
jgi:gamma-glutamyltranspeptidase/glutathione hydrolase